MYKSLEHTIRNVVEETEHRVGVTVSDPNHPMASKRDETILKHVRLKAKNSAHAEERAKAYYRKKGYKVHDTNVVNEDIGNTDKFVGNNQTDKPVPVIKPDATQDAKRASLSRANAKERTSQTMGNNVDEAVPHSVYHVSWGPGVEHEVLAKHGEEAVSKAKEHLINKIPKLKDPKYADTFTKKPVVHNISKERKLQEGGVLDTADKAAEYLVPYYSAGKKLYKGDRAGAAQDAAIDTALLATTGGVGKVLGGAARAGSKLLGRSAVKAGEKAAVTGAEKAAIGGAEKAGVSALEKDAAKVGASDLEKGAVKTAAVDAEKGAMKTAGRIGAADVVKNAVKKQLLTPQQSAPNNLNPLANRRAELKHTAAVGTHRPRKHIVHEASGDAERMKDQAVPRLSNKKRTEVDYVGRPDSPRSILTRQGEVTRKVIDEDSRAKAKTIKDTVKKKSIEQNLDDDRTKVYGEVVVNPPVNFKNLNDVEQAS